MTGVVIDSSVRMYRAGKVGGDTVYWKRWTLWSFKLAMTVESLLVGVEGQANKVDVVVGVYYRQFSQDNDSD